MNGIYVYESDSAGPYHNLAVEECLTMCAREVDCTLFLWQNRDTVVVGKNQDIYSECDTDAMERDGIYAARRLSGGGAVFHDTGNLNFSFCAGKKVYDSGRQTGVILAALKRLGIDAKCTGRNDIEAEGAKFSGNAFWKKGDKCCHHGTIMIKCDPQKMMRYLTPDKEKLRKRAVASVKARTVNLSELKKDISVRTVKDAIIRAFQEEYGCGHKITAGTSEYAADPLDEKKLGSMEKFFSSNEWIFGKEEFYSHRYKKRFVSGGVDIRMFVKDGMIKDVKVYSDSMDTDISDRIKKELSGKIYERTDIEAVLSGIMI